MAVLDNGDCAVSFSSGCVEAAIIAEAIEVFSESRPRVVRFGQGSPYIDIKLPCGGGIDALFLHDPSTDVLELALECFASRRPRSEERRVGKECVSTCRSRWSP